MVKDKTYHTSEELSIVKESFIPYSRQEEYESTIRREAINRSATEKFHLLMNLIKAGDMMKKAKISHK